MTDQTKPKRFSVTIPLAGSWTVEVDAEDKEDAYFVALKTWDPQTHMGEVDFEFHRYIVEGNVCYASQRELDVEEIDNDD